MKGSEIAPKPEENLELRASAEEGARILMAKIRKRKIQNFFLWTAWS